MVTKIAKVLTTRGRKQIKEKNFALPGGRYPIHDRVHARAALSMVAKHGTPEEQATVRAKVRAKYPTIGKDNMNKQAFLEDVYRSAFIDGIEKMAISRDKFIKAFTKRLLTRGSGGSGSLGARSKFSNQKMVKAINQEWSKLPKSEKMKRARTSDFSKEDFYNMNYNL